MSKKSDRFWRIRLAGAAALLATALLSAGAAQANSGSGSPTQGYLVNDQGKIVFPYLGQIAVAGLTKPVLADMITELDAARLLVYRAAYARDITADRVTREASEAKLFATEAAGRIIDSAVQIHGGTGLVSGTVVERLYRDVRALRIYEGTSEIQKLVIAGQLLREQVH